MTYPQTFHVNSEGVAVPRIVIPDDDVLSMRSPDVQVGDYLNESNARTASFGPTPRFPTPRLSPVPPFRGGDSMQDTPEKAFLRSEVASLQIANQKIKSDAENAAHQVLAQQRDRFFIEPPGNFKMKQKQNLHSELHFWNPTMPQP